MTRGKRTKTEEGRDGALGREKGGKRASSENIWLLGRNVWPGHGTVISNNVRSLHSSEGIHGWLRELDFHTVWRGPLSFWKPLTAINKLSAKMSCSDPSARQCCLRQSPVIFGRVAGLDPISPPCLLLPLLSSRPVAFEVGRQWNYMSQYSITEEKMALFDKHRLGCDMEEGRRGLSKSLMQDKAWAFLSWPEVRLVDRARSPSYCEGAALRTHLLFSHPLTPSFLHVTVL